MCARILILKDSDFHKNIAQCDSALVWCLCGSDLPCVPFQLLKKTTTKKKQKTNSNILQTNFWEFPGPVLMPVQSSQHQRNTPTWISPAADWGKALRRRGKYKLKKFNRLQPVKEKSRRLDWNWFQPELLSVCRLRLNNGRLCVLSRLMVLFTARCQRRNEQPAGWAAASQPAGWPTYFKLEEETLTEVKLGASDISDPQFIFKGNKSPFYQTNLKGKWMRYKHVDCKKD